MWRVGSGLEGQFGSRGLVGGLEGQLGGLEGQEWFLEGRAYVLPPHGQNLQIPILIDCPTCGLNVASNHNAYLIDLLRAQKLF